MNSTKSAICLNLSPISSYSRASQSFEYLIFSIFYFFFFQEMNGVCRWQLQPIYRYGTELKLELSIYEMCRSLMKLEEVILFHFIFIYFIPLNVEKLNARLVYLYQNNFYKVSCKVYIHTRIFFLFDVKSTRSEYS